MKRLMMCGLSCLIIVCLTGLGAPVSAESVASNAAFKTLKAEFPLVSRYMKGENLTRLYGQAFGGGNSPEDAAARFVAEHAAVFGAESNDLYPVSLLPDPRPAIPLMYDSKTNSYKFTLVYYTQFRDGVPVYDGDLRLLVRNEPGYPIVLASSGLRDLGDFEVSPGAAANKSLAESSIRSFYPGLTNVQEPKLVIWAGYGDMIVRPVLAMEVTADNNRPATADFQRWKFVINAETGQVIDAEDMIVNVDITGNVSGNATQGLGADICGEELPTALPYATVFVDGESPVFADANGDFVLPHSGNTQVDVHSPIRGQWFRVYNQMGPNSEIVQQVTPPGPANILHNESNNEEFYRAEVNGYIQANVVRDFTLTYNPTYPVIYNQQSFAVNVNINESCNAFYDGSSVNFYSSGGGCPNTAFSTVVHHEYGHHLVNVGGSGQGEYGEGMGDVVGVLITDNSGLAWGFTGNCNSPLRSADNNFQYPCTGEIHYCGQLISGCVWSTRNNLAVTNPDDYIDILANLAVNSITVHRGSDIEPDITVDYLTFDDDDNNIWNGTPHSEEIIDGFVIQHNMDFGVVPQIEHTPLVDTEDSTSALTVDANIFTFFSMEGGSATIYYRFGAGDFQTVSMSHGSGADWHGVIPFPSYGTMISYYIEAIDEAGLRTVVPENAPDTVYRFYYGADVIPPTIEVVSIPQNTVNLFGPYGPFVVNVHDVHGIDESNIRLHYRVNNETESEALLSDDGNENEFALDQIDFGTQLQTGDSVNFYFTAYDQANTPNLGRLPNTGVFSIVMDHSEIFENFEDFGMDRWSTQGFWTWGQIGYQGGHSLTYGPSYPNNSDDMAYMNFDYDLSPYSEARLAFYHRNAILGGDTCFVQVSNNGGSSWTTVGFITGYPGSAFYYDEYDITSILDPDQHDYRVGFRFISDDVTSAGILMIDDLTWIVDPQTGIQDGEATLPNALALRQNYPNPFNPQTNISFELPSASNVNLDVFDLLGRKIVTLLDRRMDAGTYTILWDGKDSNGSGVSSGIYFYRLSTEYGSRQAKMTLLK